MRLQLAALSLCLLAAPAFAKAKDAVIVPLKNSTGDDAGTATFQAAKNGQISIKISLKNMPIGEHAVHIHENPTCDTPDFKTAGGHFNPDSKQHGTLNPLGHHAGDLPMNVTIGEQHTGQATMKVNYLSIDPASPNAIYGHAIMVHEKPDDMKTDPTGNAGNRIACGVITAPTP